MDIREMESKILSNEMMINTLANESRYMYAKVNDLDVLKITVDEHIKGTAGNNAPIDYDFIVRESETRLRRLLEDRYRRLKADRCVFNMTDEEFEEELEILMFGQVIKSE